MKTIISASAIGALMLGTLASCSGGAQRAENFTDSLSYTLGQYEGAKLHRTWSDLPDDVRAKFDRQEMLRGIKEVLLRDTAQSNYVTGLSIGMQLWGQLSQMEEGGVAVDHKKVYEAYAAMFMADSIPADTMQAIGVLNNKVIGQVREMMMQEQARRELAAEQARREAPETKKAIEDGKAYIEKAKAADPTLQTTESGLVYKVHQQGKGDLPKRSDRVKVKYTGRHIDGTVFDSTDNRGGQPTTFTVSGVVAGFAEGLQMMNPGSKYTLYIPGELAYGLNGSADGSIAPMETLIFDVEVVDYDNPKTPATAKK